MGTTPVKPPAAHPCGSCPYRTDVPSGLWHESEYDKLKRYDRPTGEQPTGLFLCHQPANDGRLCSGWVGCHDMDEALAIRFAAMDGRLTGPDLDAVLDYQSPVELFVTGAQAAAHGRAEIERPGDHARREIDKLAAKRQRHARRSANA